MTLSIHAKVFLTLLFACTLVLLGTQAFVHWSLQRGLIELADARERDTIEEISERLIEIHARDAGWERLRASPRDWVGALVGRDLSGAGRRSHPEDGEHVPHWMRRLLGGQRMGLDTPGFTWPPPRALRKDPGEPPAPLVLRLMLLDRDGSPIYGRAELLTETRRFPLLVDGEPIGALALLPGPPIAELADLHFVERQGGRLWLIVIGMLALAALLAYPLSSRLIRPVRSIQGAARRLAVGDYGARVPVAGRDEIARLGRDINALASALERTDRARRQWVADISHELRTPIALLRAQVEALQDGVRPLAPSEIDRLHADLLRLARLVDDLNDLAMTDLGALTYRMVDLDLAAALAEHCEAFRERFAANGLSLTFTNALGTHRAPLHADPDRLSQLFRNLMHNSLSYTDAGGGLVVTLEPGAEGGYRIRFEDSAPGVPAEDLPRLFDRLYRVETSRNRHSGGAGLGLAITQNIVTAHGGHIEAQAANAGGCAILIEFPASGDGAKREGG